MPTEADGSCQKKDSSFWCIVRNFQTSNYTPVKIVYTCSYMGKDFV